MKILFLCKISHFTKIIVQLRRFSINIVAKILIFSSLVRSERTRLKQFHNIHFEFDTMDWLLEENGII